MPANALPIANVIVSIALWFSVPAAGSGGAAPTEEHEVATRAETEVLVKRDLAERLKVPMEEIQVVDASDRVWPDQSLGCRSRKGLQEPTPVPGFVITLTHSGRQFVYHSDRKGHFQQCSPRKKPVGPISRSKKAWELFGEARATRGRPRYDRVWNI